ncbi:MAG: hypothetical protein ACI8PT_004549 [Gammaproteobacteria bacterium]|jgi:hypothetical protein
MNTALTPLVEMALELVLEEYQCANSIGGEVKELMGNGVSESQIEAAFVQLHELGFVRAYLYRRSARAFVGLSGPEAAGQRRVWWRATASGRRASGPQGAGAAS